MARENLTYSVLDAQLLVERAVPAMHKLGSALLAYLRESPYQEDRKIALRDLLTPHRPSASRPFVYAFPGSSRDIGAFLFLLRARLNSAADKTAQGATPAAALLLRAVDETQEALHGTVLASTLGSRYDDPVYAGMLGISVWMPTGPDDFEANGDWFAAARFYRAPSGTQNSASPWAAWLRELFGSSTTP